MLRDEIHGRSAGRFTLQWHLTHACDLHCRHCYDRTNARVLRYEQALGVLDDYEAFLAEHDLEGNVCLSGGNPVLYPWFFELYQEVADRGHRLSILGNPIERHELERMVAIKPPGYFQVSLEGLEEHNDHIRGAGFFERVMDFLPMLSEVGVKSVVMTTLTDANMGQIIPLSEVLRGKADRFNFNRLSQVGEGAALGLPDTEAYGKFMIDYLVARRQNRSMGLKDNLFNIYLHELGYPLFGGCTGKGCGAAFNFVAVLPDGDVHACRKFPSPLGNLLESNLSEIYASAEAEKYRRGCSACDGCAIRSKCGGCLAVTAGHGHDPFAVVDPHCFMEHRADGGAPPKARVVPSSEV